MKQLAALLKERKQSDLGDVVVIGIDFGTTYSGAAWATMDDFENDQINLITTWPDFGREEGKAPTALLYDEDGNHKWGYDIPYNADPLQWFKLLLVPEEDLDDKLRTSDYVLRARKMLRELDKTPVDAIADFLGSLWAHILASIYKERTKSTIATMTFHVVITVPAIWKDAARKDMEMAATKANILQHRAAGPTTLTFVPEPEAAALVTLWEHRKNLSEGDVYVICDAGGGTVDLITYRVGDLNPIQLHEAVIGSGGLCGGIFIDEKFEAMCKKRLGTQWNSLSQAGIKEMTKADWEESIKRKYAGQDASKEYIVAIPAEAFKGAPLNNRSKAIKDGRFYFSCSDIKATFATTLNGIRDLIDDQIASAKQKNLSVTVSMTSSSWHTRLTAEKGIVLVGGLGCSPYLYHSLSDMYQGQGIDVLQSSGIKPRTAICRGAIFKGFLDRPSTATNGGMVPPVNVASVIARQSVGVVYRPEFVAGVHPDIDKWWDDMRGMWLADNQISWYIKKGDEIVLAKPIRRSFCHYFETKDQFDAHSFTQPIVRCSDDHPPSRKTDSVQTLCQITYSNPDMSFDKLENCRGKNLKVLKSLSFEIEMVPSGASTVFSVEYKGTKLGSQNAGVDD
ncbi:hypothetical protein NEMBOFW57_004223 [Staphylotrichum longicolle]|uniref:Actin-like ATPase domain-containing protein n=1 Tax=Staphylotrichum longicolle TaxID=669026 RepID=A0AAD4F7N7_9PEZI|nr:hypothetical protein NEMBOFW57_004223 [Staphylotrichum longicolle]